MLPAEPSPAQTLSDLLGAGSVVRAALAPPATAPPAEPSPPLHVVRPPDPLPAVPQDLLQAIADRRGFAFLGVEPGSPVEQLEPLRIALRDSVPSADADRVDVQRLVEDEAILTATVLAHHLDLWQRFVADYNPRLKNKPPGEAEVARLSGRCAALLSDLSKPDTNDLVQALQPAMPRGVRARLCRWVGRQTDAPASLREAAQALTPVRARIIQRNLRNTSRWAKLAYTGGLSWSERTLAAVTGLMRALDTIEPDGAAGYQTYARHWVKARVHRLALDHGHPSRRSNHLNEVAMRVWAAADGWAREGGEPVLTVEQVRELAVNAGEQPAAVERALLPHWGVETDPERLDGLPDAYEPNSEELARAELRWARFEQALDELEQMHNGARKRWVLEERLGLRTARRKLSDLGKEAGLSRERIRQIEREATVDVRNRLELSRTYPTEDSDSPTSSESPSSSS